MSPFVGSARGAPTETGGDGVGAGGEKNGDAEANCDSTARRTEGEMVRALDAGADDYGARPYCAEQIDTRVWAVLRRGAKPERPDLAVEANGVRIDPRARRRGWARPSRLSVAGQSI